MSYDSNLDRLTVIDLRAIAADLKISGRSKMKRAELVAVITRAEMDAKWDAAAVDAATAEHENEEIDLTSTIDDMISGWLPEEIDIDTLPDPDGSNTLPVPDGPWFDEAEAAERRERNLSAYYSGLAPCAERTTVDGIGYGCVKLGEHVEHNTALGAAWWTPTDADEQADTEAGELLDAVPGAPMESSVTVTVNRYTEGRASVTMKGHAFGDMTREAYRIGRKWELVDQEHGHVFATVRAGSLHKVVKAWAKKLGTRAAQIDVARSF